MAKQSKIQWTDATWNPWHGCKKVSPGCKFCYMYRDKERYGQDPSTVLISKTKFDDPLKWKEQLRVFTCSWSDFFIKDADEWRQEAWEIIRRTPHLTYQILTKRPENILDRLPADWGIGYPNVWLGVSVESQNQIGRLWDLVDAPAAIRFVSIEPMIGPVDLPLPVAKSINWIILGGESGNEQGKYRYRKCEMKWIYDVINQCKELKIPAFVKQLGTHIANEMRLKDRHGGDWSEWPVNIRVREFPSTTN